MDLLSLVGVRYPAASSSSGRRSICMIHQSITRLDRTRCARSCDRSNVGRRVGLGGNLSIQRINSHIFECTFDGINNTFRIRTIRISMRARNVLVCKLKESLFISQQTPLYSNNYVNHRLGMLLKRTSISPRMCLR